MNGNSVEAVTIKRIKVDGSEEMNIVSEKVNIDMDARASWAYMNSAHDNEYEFTCEFFCMRIGYIIIAMLMKISFIK